MTRKLSEKESQEKKVDRRFCLRIKSRGKMKRTLKEIFSFLFFLFCAISSENSCFSVFLQVDFYLTPYQTRCLRKRPQRGHAQWRIPREEIINPTATISVHCRGEPNFLEDGSATQFFLLTHSTP